MTLGSSLADLARAREGRRRRVSSWDRSGGNADFIAIGKGQTADERALAGHFHI